MRMRKAGCQEGLSGVIWPLAVAGLPDFLIQEDLVVATYRILIDNR
jgi:hypothetical protein